MSGTVVSGEGDDVYTESLNVEPLVLIPLYNLKLVSEVVKIC